MERRNLKPSGWVTLLRVMAIIQVVGGCLLSVILGAAVIYTGVESARYGAAGAAGSGIVVGVLIMALGVLLSFVSAAMTFVLMGMAEDIHAMRVMQEEKR